MIMNMTGGGGGGAKVTVVTGTTQPSSAKENTVWINTNATVTGWVMQYNEPSSPTQGLAWIRTSSYSDGAMNLSKDSVAMIYIVGVRIYLSGTWVTAGALVYSNGAWHTTRVYMYDNGDECSALTGGWICNDSNNYRIERNANNLTFYNNRNTANGSMFTTNAIDVTNINALHFHVKFFVSTGGTYKTSVNVLEQNSDAATTAWNQGTYVENTSYGNDEWITVNVSSLTGLYRPRCTLLRSSASATTDNYYVVLYELYGD